jgi:hypothetical protein
MISRGGDRGGGALIIKSDWNRTSKNECLGNGYGYGYGYGYEQIPDYGQ